MKSILKASYLAALVIACVFLTASAQAQSWITNGLVAYYPFNGNANDAAGTNNGIVYGATLTKNRFGVSNACYLFDGVTNKILATISNIPTNAQDRTLVLWEKFNGTNFTGTFIPVRWGTYANNMSFGAMAQGNAPLCKWSVHFYGGGQDVFTSMSIDTNWHQIICILQSNVAKLYYDGILNVSASKITSTGFSQLSFGTGDTTIFTGQCYFPGYIDDVRIYNRALSTNEVAQLYAIESQLPTMNIASTTNGPAVFYTSTNGSIYTIQMATNLASPVWATVTNGVPVYGLQITNPPPNAFFRVVN